MERARRYGTIFIVVHGLVALVHEISHHILPVGLPLWKYVIAYIVVGFAPLIALWLLWTRYRRAGAWLLLASMIGSFLYAGAHHFVLHTPDHILEAPHGSWLPPFQFTAVAMAVLELYGCWLSWWLLKRFHE